MEYCARRYRVFWILGIGLFALTPCLQHSVEAGKKKKPKPPADLRLALRGSLDTPGHAAGVDTDGTYAYVADSGPVLVIDVLDPTGPFVTGTYSGTPSAMTFVWARVHGNLLAAGSTGNRSTLASIATKSTPVHLSEINSASRPVFLDHPDRSLIMFEDSILTDFANPSLPAPIPTNLPPFSSSSIATLGPLFFAEYANLGQGGLLVDLNDPEEPIVLSRIPDPWNTTEGAAAAQFHSTEGRLFRLDADSFVASIYSYEMRSIAEATPQGEFHQLIDEVPRIAGEGSILVLSDGQELFLIDFNDLKKPKLMDQIDVGSEIKDLRLLHGFLYVAAGNAGLLIYELGEH